VTLEHLAVTQVIIKGEPTTQRWPTFSLTHWPRYGLWSSWYNNRRTVDRCWSVLSGELWSITGAMVC